MLLGRTNQRIKTQAASQNSNNLAQQETSHQTQQSPPQKDTEQYTLIAHDIGLLLKRPSCIKVVGFSFIAKIAQQNTKPSR